MARILSVVLSILFLILFLWIYKWWTTPEFHIALDPRFKLIGIIDMDDNQHISRESLKAGDDVLLVLDNQTFINQFVPAHPELTEIFNQPFDLINYDIDHEGQINNLDPIWPLLYVIVYSNNGGEYQIKHLGQAGIHAILPQHLTARGNHKVLLTDGDTRILYETTKLPSGDVTLNISK